MCCKSPVILGILIFAIEAQSRETHHFRLRQGTQCLTDKDCGFNIGCESGFCRCGIADHDLIFDKYRKNCSRIVGSFCLPTLTGNHKNGFFCVSNSDCDNESLKCRCKFPDFSPTSSGECRLNYGVTCGKGLPPCNPEKFLRCNVEWNKCTCANDDEQMYDPKLEECFARPLERCEIFEHGISPSCAKNSICNRIGFNDHNDDAGTCKCIEGFESVDSSFCFPRHGSHCDLDEGCVGGKKLICLALNKSSGVCACDNRSIFNQITSECEAVRVSVEPTTSSSCACPDNFHLEFEDGNVGKCNCRVKADNSCKDFDVCVAHAVCEENICQCTQNYKRTNKGLCKFQYKSSCLDTSECNEDSRLHCLNNTCQCRDAEEFDNSSQKCIQVLIPETGNANNELCTCSETNELKLLVDRCCKNTIIKEWFQDSGASKSSGAKGFIIQVLSIMILIGAS